MSEGKIFRRRLNLAAKLDRHAAASRDILDIFALEQEAAGQEEMRENLPPIEVSTHRRHERVNHWQRYEFRGVDRYRANSKDPPPIEHDLDTFT